MRYEANEARSSQDTLSITLISGHLREAFPGLRVNQSCKIHRLAEGFVKHRRMRLASTVIAVALLLGVLLNRSVAFAQTSNEQTILRKMWERGRDEAQAKQDAHHLFDVIGPRLSASPADLAAHDWLVGVYKQMGLEAWNETYDKLPGWRRGPAYADLIFPRVRTLEAVAAGWSPATHGPVEATVVIFPAEHP
jgi:hypothetical protein